MYYVTINLLYRTGAAILVAMFCLCGSPSGAVTDYTDIFGLLIRLLREPGDGADHPRRSPDRKLEVGGGKGQQSLTGDADDGSADGQSQEPAESRP